MACVKSGKHGEKSRNHRVVSTAPFAHSTRTRAPAALAAEKQV